MSRPRKPFGATHPGRLPATMMKVLAAEMSDPSRLRRGKQYAKDGSVLDIEIEPGIVTCEVQGSRPTPYIAAIEVTRGDGMPLRRDVTTHCTCPDDENWDGYSCKHAIAAMFVFSDELLLEPDLLDLWRGRVDPDARDERSDGPTDAAAPSGDGSRTDGGEHGPETAGVDARPSRRHLRLVGSGRPEPELVPVGPGGTVTGATWVATPTAKHPFSEPFAFATIELDGADTALIHAVKSAAPIEAELQAPTSVVLPDLPELERLDPDPPRNPQLAAVLRDALAHLRVDWD